jgi:hypothetical protein
LVTNRPAVVFVEELEDGTGARLLGRFSARLERAPRKTAERAEGLTIDEAIAWGRERAERAGVRSPPGLMWAVTIRLAPKDVFVAGAVNDDREAWDVAVASAAAAARLEWDRQLLDGFLDDAQRGETSFATFWSPAYRVYGVVAARDPADAERMVAARFAPPHGFLVDYRVRPADLTERDAVPV